MQAEPRYIELHNELHHIGQARKELSLIDPAYIFQLEVVKHENMKLDKLRAYRARLIATIESV